MRPVPRRLASRAAPRVLALVVVAAACGRADVPASDTPRSAATSDAAPATAGSASANADPRKPPCPRTGHWIDCQVRERLIRSGLVPRDTSREALPALSARPAVYRLGRGALAVYLFADSTARRREAAKLDTVKYVRAPQPPTMMSEATLIQNDNLLALLFSKNDQQIERVSDALMAGPPQP